MGTDGNFASTMTFLSISVVLNFKGSVQEVFLTSRAQFWMLTFKMYSMCFLKITRYFQEIITCIIITILPEEKALLKLDSRLKSCTVYLNIFNLEKFLIRFKFFLPCKKEGKKERKKILIEKLYKKVLLKISKSNWIKKKQ